jgi:hypothetical protein
MLRRAGRPSPTPTGPLAGHGAATGCGGAGSGRRAYAPDATATAGTGTTGIAASSSSSSKGFADILSYKRHAPPATTPPATVTMKACATMGGSPLWPATLGVHAGLQVAVTPTHLLAWPLHAAAPTEVCAGEGRERGEGRRGGD